MSFQILYDDGNREDYPAEQFSHVIDGEEFLFAVHRALNGDYNWTVSHCASGKCVLNISVMTIWAAGRMEKLSIARAEIDKLVARLPAGHLSAALRMAQS